MADQYTFQRFKSTRALMLASDDRWQDSTYSMHLKIQGLNKHYVKKCIDLCFRAVQKTVGSDFHLENSAVCWTL